MHTKVMITDRNRYIATLVLLMSRQVIGDVVLFVHCKL